MEWQALPRPGSAAGMMAISSRRKRNEPALALAGDGHRIGPAQRRPEEDAPAWKDRRGDGALAGGRADRQLPFMKLDEPFDDRQAEAGAVDRPARRQRPAGEGGERGIELVGGNSGT